jgi:hypothetical protein
MHFPSCILLNLSYSSIYKGYGLRYNSKQKIYEEKFRCTKITLIQLHHESIEMSRS